MGLWREMKQKRRGRLTKNIESLYRMQYESNFANYKFWSTTMGITRRKTEDKMEEKVSRQQVNYLKSRVYQDDTNKIYV